MGCFTCFWRKNDLSKSFADIMNHQHERHVKRMVISVMRRYAQTTDNKVDDALVDELEKRLLYNRKGSGFLFPEKA